MGSFHYMKVGNTSQNGNHNFFSAVYTRPTLDTTKRLKTLSLRIILSCSPTKHCPFIYKY